MDRVDIAVGGVRALQAFPPHEAVLSLKTVAGQDVNVHMPPTEVRRLHRLLSTIIDQFPAPANE